MLVIRYNSLKLFNRHRIDNRKVALNSEFVISDSSCSFLYLMNVSTCTMVLFDK